MSASGGKARSAARARSEKPARQRLDVEARRAQLLALGLELFSSRTYDELSIDDVAQAAGISKGLLYHYFQTKRDFYVAVIREAARHLVEQTAPDKSLALDERLRAGLDAYLGYVQQRGPAYVAVFRGGVGADAEVIRIIEETRARFLDMLLADLPIAQPPPLLRLTLRGWIGFVEATSLAWVEHPEVDQGTLRDLLAEVLINALAGLIQAPSGNAPAARR